MAPVSIPPSSTASSSLHPVLMLMISPRCSATMVAVVKPIGTSFQAVFGVGLDVCVCVFYSFGFSVFGGWYGAGEGVARGGGREQAGRWRQERAQLKRSPPSPGPPRSFLLAGLTLALQLVDLGLAEALDERELLLAGVGERLDRVDAALDQLLEVGRRDALGLFVCLFSLLFFWWVERRGERRLVCCCGVGMRARRRVAYVRKCLGSHARKRGRRSPLFLGGGRASAPLLVLGGGSIAAGRQRGAEKRKLRMRAVVGAGRRRRARRRRETHLQRRDGERAASLRVDRGDLHLLLLLLRLGRLLHRLHGGGFGRADEKEGWFAPSRFASRRTKTAMFSCEESRHCVCGLLHV